MVTVEFHTKIKDGTIRVPAKYRRNLNERVRVILVSEAGKTAKASVLKELIANPVKVASFKPLNRDEVHAR